MRPVLIAAAASLAAAPIAACQSPSGYTCTASDQCGAGGTCEPTGACSFADTTCPSGRRYGDDAPASLAGVCLIGVAIAPDHTTALAGTAIGFGATVLGSDDSAVEWAVVETDGGTIGGDGVYRAPAAAGTYHVRATSHADPTRLAEAAVTVHDTATPVVMASAGTIATATGMSFQDHLIRTDGGEWWLFYDDSAAPMNLRTRHSTDFATWTAGDAAVLGHPHSSDGRDLSVAYRRLGGHDVVHVTQGWVDASRGRYHLRAVLSAGAIAWSTPSPVNGGNGEAPDGGTTTITAGGLVIDSTGWLDTPATPPLSPCGTGDVVVYESQAVDDGVRSFDAIGWNQHVLWCVPNQVNARQLLADGDAVYQLFEDGGNDAMPVNLLLDQRSPDGVWSPDETGAQAVTPPAAFVDHGFDLADWRAVIVDHHLHVVRRIATGGYEHRIYDTVGGTWRDGPAIPQMAAAAGSGLYLARYGAGLILVAIDGAAGNPVRYAFYDGAAWSGWHALVTGAASRRGIAGADPDGARPAVIWTQQNGSAYDLAGAWLP